MDVALQPQLVNNAPSVDDERFMEPGHVWALGRRGEN